MHAPQEGELSLPCPALRRAALAVVSEWCQEAVDYASPTLCARLASRHRDGLPAPGPVCARLCYAIGTGISMPYSAAISMILSTSGCSSKPGSPASPFIGLPTSLKKRSYKPPGVWVISRRPAPSPTFSWACSVPLVT
jgi:hypothetical protein